MTTITFSEEQPSSSWPGRIAHGIQWVLFVVVMVFVVNYAAGQISRLDWSSISWSPFWLLAAIGVYFLSWVPAAFVWGELITSTGPKLDRYTILRAHYCGHIGKYVPGKALVLVIRAFLLKQAGVKVAVAGVMATAETLMTMATGLLLTLILLPVALPLAEELSPLGELEWLAFFLKQSQLKRWLIAGVVCAAAVASINPCSRLLEWVIRKLERSSHLREEAPAWRLKFFQVLRWIGLLGLGWILNACSLGCVLVGIGQTVSLSDLPVWICAAAGSTSLGFLVLFAPGGLGVRDALLMGLLQMCTPIATAHIVVIAVLVRLVSLISELLFALLLYLVPPKHPLAQ